MKSTKKWGQQLLRALAAAFAVVAGPALAAEITFYEYAGFAGQSLTLRGHTPNFAAIGFNDRAASIVVRSGSWEVCTDGEFKGSCVTLVPGEYRTLESRFDGRISSAREVGSYRDQTGAYGNGGRASIELFEEAALAGRALRLDRDAANFGSLDFNDRAVSAIVHEGVWELCADADYRGACRTYTRGRYHDLGPGMAKKVSSARVTGRFNDAPYVIGGGYAGPGGSQISREIGDRRVGYDNGRLILYEQDRFGGRSMVLTQNTVDFTATGFNDLAASAVVESGYWEVCADHYFRGQCRVLGPGRHPRLEGGVYRAISSARVVQGGDRPRDNRNLPDLQLFEHDNFAGRRFDARADVFDLSMQDFNDVASSLIVNRGQWQVCVDAGYSGRCVVYGPGRYASLLGLNDQLSSLRRVGP